MDRVYDAHPRLGRFVLVLPAGQTLTSDSSGVVHCGVGGTDGGVGAEEALALQKGLWQGVPSRPQGHDPSPLLSGVCNRSRYLACGRSRKRIDCHPSYKCRLLLLGAVLCGVDAVVVVAGEDRQQSSIEGGFDALDHVEPVESVSKV